jgi:choline dehydrogenase
MEDTGNEVSGHRQRSSDELKANYDFIVCGSGSSGLVVAGRLSENPSVSVLLLEAGGSDDVPAVIEADQWRSNLGSERDWTFVAQSNPYLNGRALSQNMGKVLGGGSSINLMGWVRRHKNDWDYFSAEARDPTWNHQSVLELYRRIEDWNGAPEGEYRGSGGPFFIRSAHASPVSLAFVEGVHSVGILTFETLNGRLMESQGGCSRAERINRAGKRQSIFRSYVTPNLAHPNLTVVTNTCDRVVIDEPRAVGVEIIQNGKCCGFPPDVRSYCRWAQSTRPRSRCSPALVTSSSWAPQYTRSAASSRSRTELSGSLSSRAMRVGSRQTVEDAGRGG